VGGVSDVSSAGALETPMLVFCRPFFLLPENSSNKTGRSLFSMGLLKRKNTKTYLLFGTLGLNGSCGFG
jgi:hypothetical protein